MFQDGSGGTRLLLSALGLHGLSTASKKNKFFANDTSREETGHDRAVLLGNAALVNAAPAKATTKLANGNAPCNRHPVGRGVLLGPPLADLGAAIAIQSMSE